MRIFPIDFSTFLKFLAGSGLISMTLEAVNLCTKIAQNDKKCKMSKFASLGFEF